MSITVAQIANLALDAVGGAITDAVHSASLAYDTQGIYDPATGTYAETTTTLTGGRAVLDTTTPPGDLFPDYTIGPGDQLVMLEGFTETPREGWRLTFAGTTYHVRTVQDIAAAGTLFYVIARAVPSGG